MDRGEHIEPQHENTTWVAPASGAPHAGTSEPTGAPAPAPADAPMWTPPPAGQPYQAQPYQAQPYPGQPAAGQPYPGEPYTSQPAAGQPYVGQPYVGQPYVGQPYVGQPYVGQPYVGQPYAGQPDATPSGTEWTTPVAGGPAWTPPPWAPSAPAPAPRRRRAGRMAVAVAAAVVLVGGGVGIGAAVTGGSGATTVTPDSTSRGTQQFPGFGSGTDGTGSDGTGSDGTGSDGTGTGSTGTGTGTGTGTTSAATAAQSKGVVLIDTVLGYQQAQAAGTGVVIAANGTVLTNNHVVEGSTSIKATVASTGKTYTATVVGTDKTDDIAVIKLTGASGLDTVSTSTTSNIAAGTAVVAVGNAGGTGSLTAASGTVTATGQSITATDESGANAEQLTNLLQTDAPIQAGDSGGPLFDGDGKVIGIDTAAETTRDGSTAAGYAIPIATAGGIAKQILAGDDTDTITLGLPAFLGVSLASDTGAATISGVIDGLPAAQAGITAGSTITAIGDRQVSSASDLSDAMASLSPGQKVSVTWTTAQGASQSASVTVVAGPAD